jgi:5,10-methenyltetrahydrofolate synthetase
MESKKTLRTDLKQALTSLNFFELIQKSANLSDHFLSLFTQTKVSVQDQYVISFYPFDHEPQINIEKETRTEPYQVGYVRIDDWEGRQMSCRVARRDQPGEWEDIEPMPNVRIFQPHANMKLCHSTEVTAILVPGLAFSTDGKRLGRGAGFYDRLLKQYPSALRIGVAFHEQIVSKIPTDEWDEELDVLLTDRNVFEMKHFGEWKKHGKILKRE